MKRRRMLLISACALSLSLLWAPPGDAKGHPPIGTNLNGPSYYSTELPFLDAFKSSGG